MKIFVYGTLMRGYSNFKVLRRAKASFVSKGFIKNKDIYYAYQKGFPVVVDGEGVVYGEIYEVPVENISFLDALEGYYKEALYQSMYIRKRAKAFTLSGVPIWVSYYHWSGKVFANLKIKSGKWSK